MEVRSYTNFSAQGSVILAKSFAEFPTSPQEGEMVQKDGRIYTYTRLANNYWSWLPISVKQSSYIHTQGVAASKWTIAHNLDATDYGLFVYDTNHSLVMVNHSPIDSNTIEVRLSMAITGTAVVFAVTDFGSSNFTATSLRVSDVLIDSTGITIGGESVASGTLISDEITIRAAADNLLQSSIDSEITIRAAADNLLQTQINAIDQVLRYNISGALAVTTGTLRYYPDRTINVNRVCFSLSTVGTSSSTIDVKVNGVSILGGVSLTATSGQYKSNTISLSRTILATDYITVDITEAGLNAADAIIYLSYK